MNGCPIFLKNNALVVPEKMNGLKKQKIHKTLLSKVCP